VSLQLAGSIVGQEKHCYMLHSAAIQVFYQYCDRSKKNWVKTAQINNSKHSFNKETEL